MNSDEKLRLFLQIQGFMQNTYLDFASEYTKLKTFKLPPLNIDIKDIDKLQMPPYLRLGNRLEKFFSFIIKQSNDFELVIENLQIIENNITLGELDFIVKDKKTNQLIHVELGGKLYLYFPDKENEEDKWIGPNKKDSLHRKLKTLNEKQFSLLNHPKTIEILQNKNISTSQIVQNVCFKARMFLPKICQNIPNYIKPENIFGYYIDFPTFNHQPYNENKYFMPEKQDWLVQPDYCEVWFSFDDILPQVQAMHQKRQSPMLWVKNGKNVETIFVLFW